MKDFKEYIIDPNPIVERLTQETKKQTDMLVDTVYSHYVKEYTKNQPECVGWLDGTENALTRNEKLYEAGILDEDSILDVGCGVAHFYEFLKNQGWKGEYLGIDPNKEAIEIIDEDINAMCGTIEDLDETKYDWVIASGVFNIGLQENLAFWTIHNMICRAKKGIVFNMLARPYEHKSYKAYDSELVKKKLSEYDNKEIKIVDGYLENNSEFTVYFYI
jgi:SAM-dependent methyltransferase